ncbi:hypothetical protein RND71_009577 [Anisodus tanguticus]|uniref:Uncharacterized protein n=1 Tax=Anisodus tanguticus TaxID=243964 RepID=A0AAE1VIB2_9SOLA|nr:hypothetical protein RND71_009577 [Anisodus tanguticus]
MPRVLATARLANNITSSLCAPKLSLSEPRTICEQFDYRKSAHLLKGNEGSFSSTSEARDHSSVEELHLEIRSLEIHGTRSFLFILFLDLY